MYLLQNSSLFRYTLSDFTARQFDCCDGLAGIALDASNTAGGQSIYWMWSNTLVAKAAK